MSCKISILEFNKKKYQILKFSTHFPFKDLPIKMVTLRKNSEGRPPPSLIIRQQQHNQHLNNNYYPEQQQLVN